MTREEAINYYKAPSYQDGGIRINGSQIFDKRPNTFEDDIKSGDALSILQIPQRSLTYGLTSLTRDEGVYTNPSEVVNTWQYGNNEATKMMADMLIEPLNLIPYNAIRRLAKPIRKGAKALNYTLPFIGERDSIPSFEEGGIHIKKKNRGKFTAAADRAGMSVQAYAKKVLKDPNASPTLKKRANFAKNAAKWN